MCQVAVPKAFKHFLARILFLALIAVVLAQDCFAQTPPVMGFDVLPNSTRLGVTGEISSHITVQFTTNLAGGSWTTLTKLTLSSVSTNLTSASVTNDPQRYYRAVITVPTNLSWISAGSFVMGSPTNEIGRGPNNETQHTVTLTKGFFMGKYLVTQGDYLSVMNTNPAYFNTNHGFTRDFSRPVEQVSWAEATNYCGRLTLQERSAGRIFSDWTFQLPSESQWEYACRAGTATPFYCGANLTNGMANFDSRYGYIGGTGTVFNTNGVFLNKTSPVGNYAPNARGLYDMAGNVWEWCQDWYTNYPTGSVTNPAGPASGLQRVFRGGTLNSTGEDCRSANRNKFDPASSFNTLGFRVVLVPP